MKRKQVKKNTYTSRQIFIKKFMKNKLAVVGSLIIIVFVICVFIGSVLVDKIRMFLWKQFWKQIEKKYGRKKA